MVGRVESDGVTARLRSPGRGASDVVEMVEEVEVLRLCLGLTSGALGAELDLSLIRAGSDSKILLICCSRGMDAETGDFALVGEAGIVGSAVLMARS
jgi:hypothetical protein